MDGSPAEEGFVAPVFYWGIQQDAFIDTMEGKITEFAEHAMKILQTPAMLPASPRRREHPLMKSPCPHMHGSIVFAPSLVIPPSGHLSFEFVHSIMSKTSDRTAKSEYASLIVSMGVDRWKELRGAFFQFAHTCFRFIISRLLQRYNHRVCVTWGFGHYSNNKVGETITMCLPEEHTRRSDSETIWYKVTA